MSQENVELVRQVFAAGEASAFYDLFDEDIDHDMSTYSLPDFSSVFHGREAVLDFYRRYWGTWAEYTAVAEEVLDAGDHVVIRLLERGRGKGSGIPFERRWYQVWTFREGKVVRWRGFEDREQALEAVGLSE